MGLNPIRDSIFDYLFIYTMYIQFYCILGINVIDRLPTSCGKPRTKRRRDRTTRKGARNGRLLVRNEKKSDELGRGRG